MTIDLPPRFPHVCLALALLAVSGVAQEPEPFELPEVVVTPARSTNLPLDTPWSVVEIDRSRLTQQSYRTLPQALRDLPGVMVQETAHGQGSPYIRGFTGFRTVLLVDGVRLNHAAMRDGPNQYWNTLDSYAIAGLEAQSGLGSVAWGSDAIGGVVQAFSRAPFDLIDERGYGAELYYRVASAEESHVAHLETALGLGADTGVSLGLSGKHFGDVRGGRDVGEQPNTGYDEWDANAAFEHWFNDDERLVVGYQRVSLNDVPRTHRTIDAQPFEGTTVGSDLRRDLDQDRELAHVRLERRDAVQDLEAFTLGLSLQRHQEERDRIRSSGAREFQGFDLRSFGARANATLADRGYGRFTFGIDYYRDTVDSFSTRNPVQGPVADDATYDLLGIFVQDEVDWNERLRLTAGVRFEHAAADAERVSDPITGDPISLDDDWSAFVGSLRFLYRLKEDELHLFGGVSQGFRAPNLSDLTRFDSARTNEFEIPAPGLDPEHYLQFELGIKAENERWRGSLATFYTLLDDQIVRVPTGGTNASGEFEITKENIGDGHVFGVELAAERKLDEAWSLFGALTFLEGRRDTFPTSAPVAEEEYLDRLMPFTGRLGARWDDPDERGWAEAAVRFADEADRLSTRDEGDTSRIPPGGTPGYAVLDLRGGWTLADGLRLDVGLENLFDEDYRIHGSGLNMPGRNLVVGLTWRL